MVVALRVFVFAGAFAVAAAGCYSARPPGGLGYPDAGAPPDARLPDGAPDPCQLDNGAMLCGTVDCPHVACPAACWPPGPSIEEIRPPHGVCLRGDDSLTVMGFEGPCPGEALLFDGPDWAGTGTCAFLPACAAIASLPWWQPEWGACFYVDGTAVRTGALRAEPCPGLEDVACGPGCANCPAGTACLGPSEASGLGICVPFDARTDFAFRRDWCGTDAVLGPRACAPGERCVRFATSPDPRLRPSDVLGECLPAEACERLARLRPDRFRCE